MANAKILIIEDDPDGARSLQEAVRDMDYEAYLAPRGQAGIETFRKHGDFDAVLSDLVLPDIDGLQVLETLRGLDAQVPVLIMTAYGSIDSSVKAMKAGAYDYITKPLDLDDIQTKLARATEAGRLRKQVTRLSASIQGRYSARNMVAVSPPMQDIVRQIETLATTNATVLICGESGTGKELAARALHADSRRAEAPFVAVNCAALSETLLESELFGHEKGAFTGAVGQHKGAFERAHEGTLFLDEIGDAPKSVQVKLLRVLEEREILRVGGQAPVKVNVRLLSATNKDLDELVEQGEFRQDLLYRLKVISLEIPPLRKRREDIRPLADRFIAMAQHEHGRHITAAEPAYYEKLERYDWPGNVRQLRNVVEASVVMAREPVLQAAALRLEETAPAGATAWAIPDGLTLEEIEKRVLVDLLQKYEGNRSLTAEKLGISRRTIQRKIKDYNLPF